MTVTRHCAQDPFPHQYSDFVFVFALSTEQQQAQRLQQGIFAATLKYWSMMTFSKKKKSGEKYA
jgi:hypothetical protein